MGLAQIPSEYRIVLAHSHSLQDVPNAIIMISRSSCFHYFFVPGETVFLLVRCLKTKQKLLLGGGGGGLKF